MKITRLNIAIESKIDSLALIIKNQNGIILRNVVKLGYKEMFPSDQVGS